MKRIAIFASGTGSNAARIIEHFADHASVQVALVVCNKPNAGVLSVAATQQIESLLIERVRFFSGDGYVDLLQEKKIDWIVLAGFLWKVPVSLLRQYKGYIVNIHPALLPSFGGKGMYGDHVHEAVLVAKATESGITIHYVDEEYDHGATIFQAHCPVFADDTVATLATRIHALEHQHYSRVIEELLCR
ncbi:MAG: phosphoribosylglycinamide formyltransferase [Sphingomonadales bacterium]